ncbi:hypothetical protein ALC56_04340 [Trachymyrmex septentrionalis]|uniref:Uncharacterized protein n=1 Tax=Trachymyrmex septentrionalis TaxID=34720 RepID=A0A195FMM3_9HYME|nr:hypothetical protein ALC56_04340 [Trachymyrmex septentrionalis]
MPTGARARARFAPHCRILLLVVRKYIRDTGRPRGGVGSEQPPSSDSDDYTAHHEQGAGYGQNLDSYTLPKVKVSGPSNADESASIINGILTNNKDNISTALRFSRTCKNCLLANYEIVLHRLRIKRSVLCDEQISCMCHEKEARLQKHESTSKW